MCICVCVCCVVVCTSECVYMCAVCCVAHLLERLLFLSATTTRAHRASECGAFHTIPWPLCSLGRCVRGGCNRGMCVRERNRGGGGGERVHA